MFPSLPTPDGLRTVGMQATRDALWPDAAVLGWQSELLKCMVEGLKVNHTERSGLQPAH